MKEHIQHNTCCKGLVREYAWEKYIAITLFFLTALYIVWAVHPVWEQQLLNDDSFITLTYAKNLVAGNGFVYNHPPSTLGTTTPLFTLLTALLAFLFPSLGLIKGAILLSIIPCISTGVVLYLMARYFKWRPLSSVILAVVPLTVIDNTWLLYIGMENWLFQFLLVLTFYLCILNRPKLAGVTVGLLFLTRGEGALIAIILVGYFFAIHKHIPLKFIIASALVLFFFLFYAYTTFGTILPNTLTAKTAQREFFLTHGLDYGFLSTMFTELPRWISSFNLNYAFGLNILLIAVIVGVYAVTVGKQYHLSLFLIWGVSYFLAYTIINPYTYPWYALHLYFVLEVLAGLGLGWVLNKALYYSKRKRITIEFACIILLYTLLSPNIHRGVNAVFGFTGFERAVPYKAVASWLKEHTMPEDSIAYLEIGYLGYFSENQIIDLAGLIDPLIASKIVKNGFTWGFWYYKPKYFLYNRVFDSEIWLPGIRPGMDQYKEVARFPGGHEGTPLVLLERVE